MLRSTIEGDMDKRQCPECKKDLQKLWDTENMGNMGAEGAKIRYFCNTCENVMVYHKDTGKMEVQGKYDVQDNR